MTPDLERRSELFGSQSRTAILLAVRMLGETYPSELRDMLGVRLYSVQRVLDSLERDAVIVSRAFGRSRRVTLNPRYLAAKELANLLWKIGRQDVALQKLLATKRRRPRRPGKPGL